MAADKKDPKKEETKKEVGKAESKPAASKSKDDESKKTAPAVPPLIASGRRLERLLGGVTKKTGPAAAKTADKAADKSTDKPSDKAADKSADKTGDKTAAAAAKPPAAHQPPHAHPHQHLSATLTHSIESILHSNPPKIVRRWLGTSSGAAQNASLKDVADAARECLDPRGVCGEGRAVLDALHPEDAAATATKAVAKMEVDEEKKDDTEAETAAKAEPQYLTAAAREFESYLLSLAIRLLLKDSSSSSSTQKAWEVSTSALKILTSHMEASAAATARAGAAGALGGDQGVGSKGLEPLLARLYRYRCLVAEKLESSGDNSAMDGEALRAELVSAHRLACLRRDVDTQATVLNLMLRDLLNADQVEQAQKLLSNSTFPDSASNNQLCRYLYHSGRIQALRLEYTSAFSNLSQCLRKAPTNTALGFRIAAQRLLVVVQLLMGEIPERTVFFTEGMTVELGPYMKITQAVRRGDLAVFHDTVSAYAPRLREDGTYTLISRLAHSVVKAGLRKLNLSYSRISLDDVAHRLGLPSAESAEFVVAKAVRDGVIDATIDRAGRFVQSHDLVDVYATTEPAEAFHRRIAYCLTTHNDAVRGMRYPPDAYKRQLEASRGLRGKKDDDKTDEEKAQELEDELDEEY